jgi:uracil-DNA glycosylase family 4
VPAVAPSRTLRILQNDIEACTVCGSLKPWRKFHQSVYGDASARYLLVGEAPGRVSWENGRRFTGPAGLLIRRALRSIGHSRYRDLEDLFYMTDAVKCHPAPVGLPTPSSSRPGANRPPRGSEARACAPFLLRELHVLRPPVIVTFGKQAARSVENAIAECARTPEMAGWKPRRVIFPHPSPRNQRTILQSYPSMHAFERAIADAFRGLISQLDAQDVQRESSIVQRP